MSFSPGRLKPKSQTSIHYLNTLTNQQPQITLSSSTKLSQPHRIFHHTFATHGNQINTLVYGIFRASDQIFIMAEHQSKTPKNNNNNSSNRGEQQPPSQQEQPTVPPLLSASPAIFTHIPSNLDLLEPLPNPPRNRIEHLEASIEALEAQRQGVRDNLQTLYRRECAHQIQLAHIAEKNNNMYEDKPKWDPVRPPNEDLGNLMLYNMENEAPPAAAARNHQQQQEETRDAMMSLPEFDSMATASHRAMTVKIVETVIRQGLIDLQGFEDFVAQRKRAYVEELEREKQRDPDAMDLS